MENVLSPTIANIGGGLDGLAPHFRKWRDGGRGGGSAPPLFPDGIFYMRTPAFQTKSRK